MDHGSIVAMDSPAALTRSLGVERPLSFRVEHDHSNLKLDELPMVDRIERDGERFVVYGRGDQLVSDLVNAARSAETGRRDLRTEEPDLEDVFWQLTGHPGEISFWRWPFWPECSSCVELWPAGTFGGARPDGIGV